MWLNIEDVEWNYRMYNFVGNGFKPFRLDLKRQEEEIKAYEANLPTI